MNIANYIQNGNPCRNMRLSFIFGIIALIFSGIIYLLSTHLLGTKEMIEFIDQIPTIQIENEQVITPTNFVFEKKIPFTDSYVLIDTTKEEPTQTVESGVMMTKTHIVISMGGQIQMYRLPMEKQTVDSAFIKQLLKQGIQNMAVALTVVLFILLWLGFMLTLILTHLILMILKRQIVKDVIKRSVFVGWLSVIALNIVLLGFGYALSFFIIVLVALAISLFCLFNSSVSQ